MVDKDKNLIVRKETIFNKLINFFKNLFRFKKNKKVEIFETYEEKVEKIDIEEYKINEEASNNESYDDVFEEIINEEELIKHEFKQDLNYETEKERLFKLYNDVKSDKKQIESLDGIDLIRINQLLKEELKLRKNS